MRERHAIYHKRRSGAPWPWTDDPILQTYRFTNVYRELDRVTVWMRRHWTDPHDVGERARTAFLKTPHQPDVQRRAGEMIFACAVFRLVGTEEFGEALGWPVPWDAARAIRTIERLRATGKKAFTSAYMLSNLGRHDPKSQVICRLVLTPLWKKRSTVAATILADQTAQGAFEALVQFKGVGPFLAYEIVSDLTHTWALRGATDLFTWANPGPGCKRGLNRVMQRLLKERVPSEQALEEMRGLLGDAQVTMPWLESLTMREIEHSLCEFDKYCRVQDALKTGKRVGLEKFTPPHLR